MRKHFVTFYSPGTLVAEQTTMPIDSWDVKKAVKMADGIVERYGARPYGFRFSTRIRGFRDLDSRVVKHSHFYYLGGDIVTLEELVVRNDPRDAILISNMKCNGWDRVVQNSNSYLWTQPIKEGDVVLPLNSGSLEQ